MDRPDPRGPGLALMRICQELVRLRGHGHELFFVHHQPSDHELYRRAGEIVVPRLPLLAGAALARHGLDAICLNGFHNRLRSFGLHFYPTVRTHVLYAHGTLAFRDDYAAGGVLGPRTLGEHLRDRKTRAAMRLSVRRFHLIQTNSAFTRRVLVEAMRADAARVRVNHLGLDHDTYRPMSRARLEPLRRRFGVDAPCVLVAATNTAPVKNLDTVLAAFRRLKDAGYPHKLLIMGALSPAARAAADALGLSPWIVSTGYLSDEQDVAGLYNLSQCLAHPSLTETFGMPLLEAFACGCPVITSDCTAMPEIAGGAALLLRRPTDAEELFARLREVADNEVLRQDLTRRGRARAACFSWRETARRYLEIVEEAAAR